MATFTMILLPTTLFADGMGAAWTVVPVLLVLAIAARIGWRLIGRYRQQVLSDEGGSGVWTMDALERMRDSGQITEQEFKVLREQVMQGLMNTRSGSRSGKSTSPGKPNDKIGR